MTNRINLLEGSIFTSLTRLALPIMATSLIQMAYNMTDMIWIGKTGSQAVASVGAAGMFMWLSNGLITLARMGGQVKVAHSLGAGESDEACIYAKNSLQLCLIFAIIYSLIVVVFSESLISFFKLNGPKVISDANTYLKIVGAGMIFYFTNQVMTGIITATGNSKIPFFVTTVGLVLNIVLDPVLIFGFGPIPATGVAGAAIATILAQAVVLLLYVIYGIKDTLLFCNIKILSKLDREYVKTIVKIGFPTAIQGTLFTAISMILARMVANWGDVAIAVQKVGSQIESIAWMTAEGFACALNSFTGQNYGANNFKRAKNGYFTAIFIIIIWGIISTCLLVFIPKTLFTIFINEPEAVPYGIDYLIILGYSQLPMCIEIVTAGAFAGFGKTMPPSVISILFTSMRIPMAIFLSGTVLALNGIWWSITISSIFKGVVLLVAFLIFVKKMDKCLTIGAEIHR